MSESKVRCRKNRKYGTMKNEKRTTIQLSHEVKEYLQSEAKRLKISFSEAIEMLVRAFAESE